MNFAEFVLGSIPLLIQFYADLYRESDFQNTLLELESEYNVPKVKTYDFIIVGGGSAGCVLAGRLSESFNVLLLEAGGNPPPAVAVPYFSSTVSQAPSINYFFRSVPNTNAALNNNGISSSATGRMMGGTGSHNVVTHNRGSPMDYDNWSFLLNDDSFNYTNVIKYFKRMETFIGKNFGTTETGDEYYGNDGPIVVDTRNHPIQDLWFKAGRELGYPIEDPNGYQREGFSPRNVAIRKGQRSSSYVEYIKPYESLRSTLTVIRYANVSEILLDDEKKAYGVAYTRHGLPQIAHAKREIVLSAGTYSTPLLLMKSGIGPESILNAADIPVKVPLEAVGKNLRDHLLLSVSDFSVNDTSLFLKINPSDTEKISEEYHNGEGVLAMTSTGPIAFIASSKTKLGWPDIQLEISAFVTGELQRISFINFLRRPKSIGMLSLDTEKYKAGIRDNVQLALIHQKLLTHPDDVEALLDGVKVIFKIAETEPFKSINCTYAAVPDPACNAFAFLTDDYWKCRAQQRASSSSHPVGTCSMGPDTADSTTSVVDTKFRVRGVSNLMIVDASVMPEITNTNINAAVMMLAEKAAEDIINYYQVTQTTNTDSRPTDVFSETTHSFEATPNASTSILADTNKFFFVSIFFLFFSQCLYMQTSQHLFEYHT